MSYLSSIISGIEDYYKCKIKGEYHPNTLINSIRFLTKEDADYMHLLPNNLYIGNYEDFKNYTIYGCVLYICNENEKPKDKMYIQDNIDLIDLYNHMSDIMEYYNYLEQQKQALFQSLYNGNGLNDLLKATYHHLDNPIVLLDSTFTVLSMYPADTIDTEFFTSRNNRLSLDTIHIQDMKDRKIVDKIYHSVHPFIVNIPSLPCPCVIESVRIKSSVIGYIFIRCDNRQLSRDELDYIHVFTQMISIQLQKDESYQSPFRIKYETFFKDLFSNHYEKEKDIIEDLKELEVVPKKQYVFVASGFINNDERLMATEYYCMQLSMVFKNSIHNSYRGYFISLISIDSHLSDIERYEDFLNMNHMKGAFSYMFDDLLNCKPYLNQCINQLKHDLTHYSEKPISYHEDFFLKNLFQSSNNVKEMQATIHPAIKNMYNYDTEHKTEYIKTLRTYFQNNRSASMTSKVLYIHKSTFFYRLDKMINLFHLHLENADSLFAYEFSLRLLDISKGK